MSLCERVKAVFNEVNYQCRLLGELVYPRRCAVCKNEIDTGYFCEACRKNFALGKMLTQVDNIDEVFLCYKYHQELQECRDRESKRDIICFSFVRYVKNN